MTSSPEPSSAPTDRLDGRLVKMINTLHYFALHDDMDKLAVLLMRLGGEFGAHGVGTAMLALVDWYALEAGLGPGDPPPNALAVLDPHAPPEQYRRVDIDTVDPASAWAVRAVMARLMMDEQQWRALMTAVPNDEAEFGRYLMTLYKTVGANVRRIRAGFDPMPARPRR